MSDPWSAIVSASLSNAGGLVSDFLPVLALIGGLTLTLGLISRVVAMFKARRSGGGD